MKTDPNLYSTVYDFLEARILFGTYRAGDQLPTLRCLADLFLVSPRTVTSALRQLEEKRYIHMPARERPVVTLALSEEEISRNLLDALRLRHDALIDLLDTIAVLFPRWMLQGMTACGNQELARLETVLALPDTSEADQHAAFVVQTFKKLGNPMLVRIFFIMDLFFYPLQILYNRSQPGNLDPFFGRLLEAAHLAVESCKQKKYAVAEQTLRWMYGVFPRLYGEQFFSSPAAGPQVPFVWPIHKERPQVRASIVAVIIGRIYTREYPAGEFLPPTHELMREFSTSKNTIRRSVDSLTVMGIVQNVAGRGIKVSTQDESRALVDFMSGEVQKNLFYYLKGLQIMAISGTDFIRDAFLKVDPAGRARLEALYQDAKIKNDLFFAHGTALHLIIHAAPYAAIREIFMRLAKLWVWGAALWYGKPSFHAKKEGDFIEDFRESLSRGDAGQFAETFRSLTLELFNESKRRMLRIGVPGTEKIVSPYHSGA